MHTNYHCMSAISIQHATVRHGDVIALDDITLDIAKGKWTAIIGPNGAGKSTLLRVCAGLIGAASSVEVLSKPLTQLAPHERATRVAWLGQNESVYGDISVYDLVMLGRLPHLSWFEAPSSQDHLRVLHALEIVHAERWKDRLMSQLSGGEQQRVLIARALAVDAEILLLDEPLTNLDPPHQSDCLNLIRSVVAQGKTVVTVLHEIAFALCAEEIVVIDEGRVFYQGLCTEISTHRHIEEVFHNRIEIFPFKDRLVVLPA